MNKRTFILSLLGIVVFALLMACSDPKNVFSESTKVVAVANGTFTDSRDGQIYKTVTIGSQTWMAENLNYETEDSYCYGDKAVGCVKYGRFYSLKSARKACPAEWRLPTPMDWSVLIYSMGGEAVAGKKLKSTEGWLGNGNGTDDFGFAAIPAGAKYGESSYSAEGKFAIYWGNLGDSRDYAYAMILDYYNAKAVVENEKAERWLSVRCIKENILESSSSSSESSSSSSALVQDCSVKVSSSGYHPGSRMEGNLLIDLRDNQVYKTTKIGNQTWMAENLNYKTENSSCNLVQCTESGRNYTWDDALNACPDGWHLPTRAEWKSLISYVGGRNIAGKMLRATSGSWYGGFRERGPFHEMFTVNGSNDYGFGATESDYWSASEDNDYNAYHLCMTGKDGSAELCREGKKKQFRVRCLMGEARPAVRAKRDRGKSKAESVCSSSSVNVVTGSMTDPRDGQTYKTVDIGSQTWMAENLKYQMDNTYCYDNDAEKCLKYGRLYGWSVAKDACPAGWHLPSLDEWDDLLFMVGGRDSAEQVLRSKTTDWGDSAKGLDQFKFSALPGGFKDGDKFKRFGQCADFWTSTECDVEEKCMRTVSFLKGKTDQYHSMENDASSIRCLKDKVKIGGGAQKRNIVGESTAPANKESFVDSRDGQIYRTVKIGNQTWMAENLNYKRENSFCYRGDENYCTRYGRLYEWNSAVKACPAGWHLPSIEEWETLFIAVGSRSIAGTALKSKTGWRDHFAGTDDYGFTALPAGIGYKEGRGYRGTRGGEKTYWWTTSSCQYYSGCKQAVSLEKDDIDWTHGSESGYSVRCLKNAVVEKPKNVQVTPSALLKDARDGRTYKTVKIGSQTWMAENLNYKTEKSVCKKDDCEKYGRVYTWNAAIDCEVKWVDEDGDGWGYNTRCAPLPPVRGICPTGWHLPSVKDWNELVHTAGGIEGAKEALLSQMDKSNEKNNLMSFWSSTDFEGDNHAYFVGNDGYISEGYRSSPTPVRCLKDDSSSLIATNRMDSLSIQKLQNKEKQNKTKPRSVNYGVLTDSRDGKNYKTVTIGAQTWMAENLNYKIEKSICRSDSISDCASIGRLYSWNLAKEACPSGWRLPAREDWDTLFTAVGGQSVAGSALRSFTKWYGNGNGSDAYGFSALPINAYGKDNDFFRSSWNTKEGRSAFFWTFTEYNKDSAYVMYLLYYANNADFDKLNKSNDFSIRCIKGELPDGSKTKMIEAAPLTDARDGQTYKTVKIGKQTWMAENLNFAAPNSRCSLDSTDKDSLSSCAKYGRYYKWATAMDSAGVYSANAKGCGAEKNCIPTYPVRGICPEGWHLPSRIEWNVLISNVGGIDSAGKALKTVDGWKGDAIGSDDYGFSALPYFSYWSSTEDGYNMAYQVGFDNDRDYARFETSKKLVAEHKIRCVMDIESPKAKDEKQTRTESQNVSNDSNVVFDSRDGQIYKTVKIGTQTWMAENLNYETEYSECLDNYVVNCSKYGRLYPWSVAMDSAAVYSENGKGCGHKSACFPTEPVQGICPDGWHLPSNREWMTLSEAVGGQSSAHVALKTTYGWKHGSNGSDEFGFSAFPTSMMHEPWKYRYEKRDNAAFFWSSTKYDAENAQVFLLHDHKKDVPFDNVFKNSSLSVRCVKNELPKKAEASSDSLSGQSANMGTLTDPRDGQTYKTISVGKYTWMAENMKFETENSICYDNDPVNCDNYGRLYEWKALKTVCPTGWHLPTEAEWDTLFLAVGGQAVAGKKLKSTRDWLYCDDKKVSNNDGNGTDEIGFSVRPVGFFNGSGSVVEKEGYMTCFHTAEKDEKSMENEMCFSYCSDSVARTDSYTYKALSVRCIKDYSGQKTQDEKQTGNAHVAPPSSTVKGTFTDPRDGQTYKIVKIGKQTWMAQNINYKTKNRKCLDFDSTQCDVYGGIYPWADAKKACPAGWHLSTDADWDILINAVGDSTTAARALKSSEGWVGYKDVNGGGSDEYGFSAQPVGDWFSEGVYAWQKDGLFSVSGFGAGFWTSKELNADSAYVVGMGYFYGDVFKYEESKSNGVTVRCVKN